MTDFKVGDWVTTDEGLFYHLDDPSTVVRAAKVEAVSNDRLYFDRLHRTSAEPGWLRIAMRHATSDEITAETEDYNLEDSREDWEPPQFALSSDVEEQFNSCKELFNVCKGQINANIDVDKAMQAEISELRRELEALVRRPPLPPQPPLMRSRLDGPFKQYKFIQISTEPDTYGRHTYVDGRKAVGDGNMMGVCKFYPGTMEQVPNTVRPDTFVSAAVPLKLAWPGRLRAYLLGAAVGLLISSPAIVAVYFLCS